MSDEAEAAKEYLRESFHGGALDVSVRVRRERRLTFPLRSSGSC